MEQKEFERLLRQVKIDVRRRRPVTPLKERLIIGAKILSAAALVLVLVFVMGIMALDP